MALGGKIENLATNTGLVRLDLSFNYITKIEGLVSQALLQELDLSHNQITAVENLPGRALVELSLADNSLGSLTGLKMAKRLESLDLSGNQLVGGLALPSGLPVLASLRLNRNQLAGLGKLSHACPGLVELEAAENMLELLAIAQLPPSLTELSLAGNPAATAGVAYRQAVARQLQGLERLDGQPADQQALVGAGMRPPSARGGRPESGGGRPGSGGGRPGSGGLSAGPKPLMRPPSARTETLAPIPDAAALGGQFMNRLSELRASLLGSATPRELVEGLPPSCVTHINQLGLASRHPEGRAVLAAGRTAPAVSSDKRSLLEELPEPEPEPKPEEAPGSGRPDTAGRGRHRMADALAYGRSRLDPGGTMSPSRSLSSGSDGSTSPLPPLSPTGVDQDELVAIARAEARVVASREEGRAGSTATGPC